MNIVIFAACITIAVLLSFVFCDELIGRFIDDNAQTINSSRKSKIGGILSIAYFLYVCCAWGVNFYKGYYTFDIGFLIYELPRMIYSWLYLITGFGVLKAMNSARYLLVGISAVSMFTIITKVSGMGVFYFTSLSDLMIFQEYILPEININPYTLTGGLNLLLLFYSNLFFVFFLIDSKIIIEDSYSLPVSVHQEAASFIWPEHCVGCHTNQDIQKRVMPVTARTEIGVSRHGFLKISRWKEAELEHYYWICKDCFSISQIKKAYWEKRLYAALALFFFHPLIMIMLLLSFDVDKVFIFHWVFWGPVLLIFVILFFFRYKAETKLCKINPDESISTPGSLHISCTKFDGATQIVHKIKLMNLKFAKLFLKYNKSTIAEN